MLSRAVNGSRSLIRRCFNTPTLNSASRIQFSSATSEPSASTAKTHVLPNKFSLFPHPKEVVPVMELTRRLGGNVAETIYQIAFEKQYSRESLIRGANQGICVMAESVADGNWDRLASVATADLTAQAQAAKEGLSTKSLDMFRFSDKDIVHSFLHSSVIAGKHLFKLSATGNLGVYFTVVSFIRLSQSVPDNVSLIQAVGKYKNDLLVANVTFARTLNPLGPWKATAFNLFIND